MSKNLDRILEVLDVAVDGVLARVALSVGLCWRCRKNKSAFEDHTCDDCMAYLHGETVVDPRVS